uniref:BAH domain-containing protein n=1 Tax=Kalanchoe fedtschenkoi TaxID=63787 RepID=A0A7N0T8T1_KALFE
MAATQSSRRKFVDSYTIPGSAKLKIQAGDNVILRPKNNNGNLPLIVKIDGIHGTQQMKNVKIRARWYYWPEDTIQGRRFFHGLRELFLSDHSEDHYVECIDGKCKVRTLNEYQELNLVMDDDYFWRFQHLHAEGKLIPESVEV